MFEYFGSWLVELFGKNKRCGLDGEGHWKQAFQYVSTGLLFVNLNVSFHLFLMSLYYHGLLTLKP